MTGTEPTNSKFTHRLYASHWMGEGHTTDECQPYLFSAKLLPLGETLKCANRACEGSWTLMSTADATSALRLTDDDVFIGEGDSELIEVVMANTPIETEESAEGFIKTLRKAGVTLEMTIQEVTERPVSNPDCEDGGPGWCCIDSDGTGLWCDSCLTVFDWM